MKIREQTIVRRNILLDETEEFTIKPPQGWRKWRVNLIEVNDGYFILFGGPGKNSRRACLRLHHGYRSTSELPSMPSYVAEEVTRSMEQLEGKSAV